MFDTEGSLFAGHRLVCWLLSAIFVATVAPRSAWAKHTAASRTASVLIAEADDAVQAGDIDTAIKRLALAYKLDKDVQVGVRLGRLLTQKGRLAEAQGVLREVAAEKPPPWIAKQTHAVKEAKKELADLAKRQPWIRVDVTGPPKGTTIKLQLDGRDIPAGTWLPVDPGHRVFEASAQHFQSADKDLDVKETSRQKISLKLSPVKPPVTTGLLDVSTQGNAKADLYIDGKRVGPLPWHGDLAPGNYKVQAKGPKASSPSTPVKVALGKTIQLVLKLKQQTGLLDVISDYPGASVYVDGALVGKGQYKSQVAVGKHQITLMQDGFYPASRTALVKAGGPTDVRIDHLEAIGAAAPVGKRPYHGPYVRVAPTLLIGLGKAPDEATWNCVGGGATCDNTSSGGLGLQIRAGWNFGIVGVEYMLLGSVDRNKVVAHRDAGLQYRRDETYQFYRYGGAAGLGLRLTTHGRLFRFSFGVGGGLAVAATQYKMTAAFKDSSISVPKYVSAGQIYVAPALTSDVGVLIGHTPGIKFYAGVEFYSELVPFSKPANGADSQTLPADPVTGQAALQQIPALQLVAHPQFFIGPALGVQFGR